MINNDSIEKNETPSSTSKPKQVFRVVFKCILLIACLYSFIISLNLMSSAFPLIGGRYTARAFRHNVVLTNPFAGLVIGLLATVVVQSSSTSTSIVVSMVASEIIPVKYAIPIVMGTNIGTSITSTLVALSQAGDKERFRRSFAGATVHDMFNWLSVIVLLPIEIAFGYLERTTRYLVGTASSKAGSGSEPELLNALVKPITYAIIQIDKRVLDEIALDFSNNEPLIKKRCADKSLPMINGTYQMKPCKFLFANVDWPEWVIGTILLAVSLVTLCGCLILLVRVLSSIFKGPVAHLLNRVVNAEFPGIWKHFTGYLAILLGCALTILVQSSSVFTSTLTPLVGLGLISLERLFPLTLGSNIGTTITGILASLSGPSRTFKSSFQIALCHTIFNVTGILIWYPIPCLRRIPINLAKWLGDVTADYKWFAMVYTIGMFVIFPIFTFFLSLFGMLVFVIVDGFLFISLILILKINWLQRKKPKFLPSFLRNWSFLPKIFRSLDPYDKFIRSYLCFLSSCKRIMEDSNSKEQQKANESKRQQQQLKESTISNGFVNNAYDQQQQQTSEQQINYDIWL